MKFVLQNVPLILNVTIEATVSKILRKIRQLNAAEYSRIHALTHTLGYAIIKISLN